MSLSHPQIIDSKSEVKFLLFELFAYKVVLLKTLNFWLFSAKILLSRRKNEENQNQFLEIYIATFMSSKATLKNFLSLQMSRGRYFSHFLLFSNVTLILLIIAILIQVNIFPI